MTYDLGTRAAHPLLIPVAPFVVLFGAMFALIGVGRRLGAGRNTDGLGTIDGADSMR